MRTPHSRRQLVWRSLLASPFALAAVMAIWLGAGTINNRYASFGWLIAVSLVAATLVLVLPDALLIPFGVVSFLVFPPMSALALYFAPQWAEPAVAIVFYGSMLVSLAAAIKGAVSSMGGRVGRKKLRRLSAPAAAATLTLLMTVTACGGPASAAVKASNSTIQATNMGSAACLLGGNLLIPLAAGPRWIAIAVIATGGFCVGLGVIYLIILRATLVQRTIHYELLGRVGSVMRLIEWGPGPFGAVIGGLLGQVLGLRLALVILGVGCLLGVPWIAVAAFRGHLSSVQS